YQLSAFDRRFHSGQELPEAPLESDLQDVRLELIDRIENGEGSSAPSMALAELTREAQEAKVIPLRLDEIPVQTQQEVPVSSSLRWFVPGAAVAVFGLIVTFNFLSSEETTLTADVPVVEKTRTITRSARPAMPQPKVEHKPVVRAPASIPHYRPPQPRAIDNAYARESRYPTRVETHNNNDRYPSHEIGRAHV